MRCHGAPPLDQTGDLTRVTLSTAFAVTNELAAGQLWSNPDLNSDNSVNSVQKNRLKRDRHVFFIQRSGKLAGDE
jgi:hypothetical protein